MNLIKYLEELKKLGLLREHKEPLNDIYEVTIKLWDDDKKDLTSIFKVRNKEIFQCVGNLINSRSKISLALGVRNIEEAYQKIIESEYQRGKLKEESFSDYFKKLNLKLDELPAIKFYEKDGGKYITSAIFIAKSLDGKYNASFHRMMVLGGNKAVIRLVPRHLFKMYEEYIRKGKDLPVAVVIGVDPAVLIASALSPPYGVFELEIASSFLGGLNVVRTPQNDVVAPAHSFIVIEGRLTKERHKEGPFVDLLMTYDIIRMEPVFIVDNIYVNKLGGYFHVILPGGKEHQLLMGFPKEASIWYAVSKVVSKVKSVRLTYGGGGWLHAVISIEKNSEGDSKNAILAAFAAHPSLKHVVVVDTDINIDNPYEIEWAIATRFQASKDLIIIRSARGSTLDPSASEGLSDKVGIDATAPIKQREKFIRAQLPKCLK